ncbi:FliA/WhiG family RNA polymerase sigma factor [Xanthomonas campestris pv. phormiicola]|nr:FliA/WhiG family RNA polymerase sigma factor [Xanthomonas campestris pv. phormiicola]UYC17867.1 FliA/WhiG family RNA polymerase sigma factor [Xanthomonas campestris pv. phormiicola]
MNLHHVEYTQLQCVGEIADPLVERDWMIQYVPLVKRVVGNLAAHAGTVMERDDMQQIGLMGLLEALRRYGTPDAEFVGYAAMRIRGAILDELRRQDWRTRSARNGAHRLHSAERTLRQQLGRDPERAEVCQALNISSDEYDRAQLHDNAEKFASFDALLANGLDIGSQQAGPELHAINQASLAQALLALDEREQKVVQLYYEFDLGLAEIAQVLDLTTSRICQINKRALAKMRAALE